MNNLTFTTGYDFTPTANAQDMDLIDAQVLQANTNLIQGLGYTPEQTHDLVNSLEPELLIKHLFISHDPSGANLMLIHFEVQDMDFATLQGDLIDIDDYTSTIKDFITKLNIFQHLPKYAAQTIYLEGTNTFITAYIF